MRKLKRYQVITHQTAEPQWLTAIDFMSGAVVAVQAGSANAKILALTSASLPDWFSVARQTSRNCGR